MSLRNVLLIYKLQATCLCFKSYFPYTLCEMELDIVRVAAYQIPSHHLQHSFSVRVESEAIELKNVLFMSLGPEDMRKSKSVNVQGLGSKIMAQFLHYSPRSSSLFE